MKHTRDNIVKVDLSHYYDGDIKRFMNQSEILEGEPNFPQPVEYVDIDKAMIDFVNERIPMYADGKLIPTFTLYSNQRFSEYSQTWEHTDEDGNLLMNFKTVTRGTSPKAGSLLGGARNIPGNRKYTLRIKNVLEDNGNEAYEIYSMKQPFTIDMDYYVAFITSKYEHLNLFNTLINDLFKSLQCYLQVNGHWFPLLLDDISDETEYSIDSRKFFVQAAAIKVRAYIIRREDFEVKKYPKKMRVNPILERKKPYISFFESEEHGEGAFNELNIDFIKGVDKVSFDVNFDMDVCDVSTTNIRVFKVYVDGELFDLKNNQMKISEGTTLKVVITRIDKSQKATITFKERNF